MDGFMKVFGQTKISDQSLLRLTQVHLKVAVKSFLSFFLNTLIGASVE